MTAIEKSKFAYLICKCIKTSRLPVETLSARWICKYFSIVSFLLLYDFVLGRLRTVTLLICVNAIINTQIIMASVHQHQNIVVTSKVKLSQLHVLGTSYKLVSHGRYHFRLMYHSYRSNNLRDPIIKTKWIIHHFYYFSVSKRKCHGFQ